MFLQTGILILFFSSAHALLRLRPLDGDVEHVKLDQIHTAHDRVERSAEDGCQFPYLLRFRFEINGTEVNFNLQLNDQLQTNIPLFVMNGGQLKKKETLETKNFAPYQDPNKGSAMLVSCEDGESFSLHGSFYHDGQLYHMSPSNVPELSHKHFIQRHEPNKNNFLNDAVDPPSHFTNKNKQPEGPARKKRQTSTWNIVEVLFAADVSIYDYFLEDQGTDAAAEVAIQQYMSLLLNEIDLHYISVGAVDSSVNIRLYLSGVIIAKTARDSLWSTNSQSVTDGLINGQIVTKAYLDNSVILDNIRTWRGTQSNLPSHDHMMALSMIDLANFGTSPVDTGYEGRAYVGTVCNSEYMVSFSEVDGSRVSLTAAHELGHGLGSKHDGEADTSSASCSAFANNIMTSSSSTTTSLTYAEAQWTFSQCSVAAFKDFINGLSSNCMQEHSFSGEDLAYVEQQQQRQLPGEIYSLDQQCQMYGSTSSCQSTISEDDCYNGYQCSTDSGCSGTFYPLYPLAGTPCGSISEDNWCYRGRCIARTVLATTTTTTDSTTSSTTSTTSSTTTSTIPSTTTTTSTTSSTTSTTPVTTSTTSTTTSTSPATTTTSDPSSTSTTSTTSSTSTTTTTSTSSTSTSTPSTTTATISSTTSTATPTTTTSACTHDKCCKKFKVGRRWFNFCCRGDECCSKSWAQTTTCYNNCCPSTTPIPTQSPFCSSRCCVKIGWGRNRRHVCCTGNDCCGQSWGISTSCCRFCPDNTGNGQSTATTPATTTTTEACFRGKCCGTIKRGRKTKRVCCKGKKCCRFSWATDSICCRTCS